jgi:uncharacterized protein with HEPN domain
MRDAAQDGLELVRTRTRAALDKYQWLGLVKCIEIIGEAATKVTPERRQRHPEIAWTDIAGMRHRLVHDYDRIDYDLVWDTATKDLPPLVEALERIVGPTN